MYGTRFVCSLMKGDEYTVLTKERIPCSHDTASQASVEHETKEKLHLVNVF